MTGKAWARGRLRSHGQAELLFGSMYEDSRIELETLPAGGRIFCIASAGCTALALAARGDAVTAVDLNPAQVAYLRARLARADRTEGAVERLLARARALGWSVGWNRSTREAFCAVDDAETQAHVWRTQMDTARFRAATALLLSPLMLRGAYARDLTRALPHRFHRVLLRRLERGLSRHSNADNPYARLLLLGVPPRNARGGGRNVDVVGADAAEYLEATAPASFDGFSLSNVLDGAGSAYQSRLLDAVERAAAPGATAVLRSIGEPERSEDERWALRDRSLIWGSVRVERLGGG